MSSDATVDGTKPYSSTCLPSLKERAYMRAEAPAQASATNADP